MLVAQLNKSKLKLILRINKGACAPLQGSLMSHKPNLTIGLCVKDIEATVAHTMESILQQDFPHESMELIVVDGHSKDKTLYIIKKYLSSADITSRFFFENNGLGFARQIVVDNALGDYVVWVDGDIVLTRDYARKQVGFMERHPAVGIGRAKYGIWPESGPIAYLENIPFVVETAKYSKNVPLGICGTEGAIHRVKAMRQVGGFDVNIKGAAEDVDLARRILALGWAAEMTNAVFYELCRDSWKDLWNEYAWWGHGGHFEFHKYRNSGLPIKMSPLGGFLAGCLRFPAAYKLTRRKLLFLLPFHYAFKRLAFCYGFTKAHADGYGHRTMLARALTRNEVRR
jgi:glycosyltransferase involved in cell wall biosynthesis